jgi:LuxR family maltose regulon positive regulatory protein
MESRLGILLGAMAPDNEAVLSAFINEANDVPERTAFVLDDYHRIEEPAIHEALTFLLDHLPSDVHFVLAVRGEPPLPLARYRAHGKMLVFRAQDLRFLPQETRDFLNEGMGMVFRSSHHRPRALGLTPFHRTARCLYSVRG